MDRRTAQQIFVRAYRGNADEAYAAFQDDAEELADDGWAPINQQWTPGGLPNILAGLAWIAWIWTKRLGTLWVTYQGPAGIPVPEETFEEWVLRVGVQEARMVLEDQVRDGAISRDEYNDQVAEMDAIKLD